MWLRAALNDIFHSNTALSEFTELIFLVCWVPVAPQGIKHIKSKRKKHACECHYQTACVQAVNAVNAALVQKCHAMQPLSLQYIC